MPKNFQSKLYIKVQTEDGQFLLSPIIDMNPTINTPNIPEHSIEEDNLGVSRGNDTFTFTCTVKAIKDEEGGTNPSKILTELALKHKPFNIVMTERKLAGSSGKEWAFETLLLENCYVNTANPSRATLAGSPVAIFTCMCLGLNLDGEAF